MIQSSTMSAVELVRANGFLPIEKHESAAVALDLTGTAISQLEALMVNLHELSGTTKPVLVAGLNQAFYDIKRIVELLQA